MRTPKLRLDRLLLERGLASNEREANGFIMAGRVVVEGVVVTKPGTLVAGHCNVHVRNADDRYVSRGGHKLQKALQRFELRVAGKSALDAGASAGGFTDCMLQHGVTKVYSADVGYGQIHSRLRQDPRVVVLERTNISDLHAGSFAAPPEFCAADLSYLSLRLAVPILEPLLAPAAPLVCLIKPLYEGLAESSLADLAAISELLHTFLPALDGVGARRVRDLTVSPITGGRGAIEFLTWLAPETAPRPTFSSMIERSLEEAAAGLEPGPVS